MRWVGRELSSEAGTHSVFIYISVAVGVVVTLCVCDENSFEILLLATFR